MKITARSVSLFIQICIINIVFSQIAKPGVKLLLHCKKVNRRLKDLATSMPFFSLEFSPETNRFSSLGNNVKIEVDNLKILEAPQV